MFSRGKSKMNKNNLSYRQKTNTSISLPKLKDEQLLIVSGGVALSRLAVQAAREAARNRTKKIGMMGNSRTTHTRIRLDFLPAHRHLSDLVGAAGNCSHPGPYRSESRRRPLWCPPNRGRCP